MITPEEPRPEQSPAYALLAQVYKGLYHGVQPVAVKVLHADTDPRVVEEFVKEVRLLGAISSRRAISPPRNALQRSTGLHTGVALRKAGLGAMALG